MDKKVAMETDQLAVFNEFLKNTNLKKFEISTKPYFFFNKFFSEFFFQMFSLFDQSETEPNQKLLEKEDFIDKFNKLIKSHSNFARGKKLIEVKQKELINQRKKNISLKKKKQKKILVRKNLLKK